MRGTVTPRRVDDKHGRRDKRPDVERSLSAALPGLQEAGVTVASFALAAFAYRPEDVRPFLERLGKLERSA